MKKLLLLISLVFFALISFETKAQSVNVSIDSLVVTDDIDCNGEDADIMLYVDNDTNALPPPQCNPNCGPLVSYQVKGFTPVNLGVTTAFASSQTTGSSIPVNGINEGTYYVLIVDSLSFVTAFPPSQQFFSNLFGTPWSTVLAHPSVYDLDTIIVVEPLPLTVSDSSLSNNLCFGDCNASHEITLSGGTTPYSIDGISFSGSSDTISGLCAGTSSYLVTDANGCDWSSSNLVTVNAADPNQITLSYSTYSHNGQDISCAGESDGEITINASGGTGTIQYSDDGINFSTTNVFDSLPSGSHTFYVKDANDCDTTITVTLTDPPLLSGTISINSAVSCNGFNDGIIQFNVDNINTGTSPHSYTLNGTEFQPTSSIFDNLFGDQYHEITVEDINGCTFSDSIFLPDPPAFTISANVVDASSINDGSIDLTVSGATFPYSYLWSGPNGFSSTLEDITGLSAGTYSCIIFDNNACDTIWTGIVLSSCTYGCTDSTAINYDSLATCDDGSCFYANCQYLAPINNFVTNITDTRATINWNNLNSNNCMVLKYVIRYRELGTNTWTTKSGGAGNGSCNFGLNNTSKELMSLSPSTIY